MTPSGDVDLGDIQLQSDQLTNESLESTRRMLQLAEETQETGMKTLVALDEQGDQLDRIDGNLDQINADMKQAEKNLSGLEKFCGLCTCCWNRGGSKSAERSEAYKKGFDNDNYSSGENSKKTRGKGADAMQFSGEATSSGGYINRVTNDDREDEMDENLGQVAGIVGNLKSMALEMGEELDGQNKKIEDIQRKAEENQFRVEDANKRAEKILRK